MNNKTNAAFSDWKVGWGAYVALIAAIIFFSGLLYQVETWTWLENAKNWKWLGAFDFTTLSGSFGNIVADVKGSTFVGKGGEGARSGFLFALGLVPTVMLALGMLEIFTHYGAIRAAHKLMTPVLRPILGVPGRTGLALITDLQSTDAGAALTKELYDEGEITKKELVIISAWQYSGAGLINNYYAIGSALFSSVLVPVVIPLLLMFILKFVGGVFVRSVLNSVYKKDFEND